MKLTAKLSDLKIAIHQLAAVPGEKGQSVVAVEADEFGGLSIRRNTNIAGMRVGCRAEIEEPGEVYLDFEALSSLVSRWNADIVKMDLDKKTNKLRFKSGTSTAALALFLKSQVHGDLPKPDGIPLTFAASKLKEWIGVSIPAIYTGAGRDYCMGMSIRTCLDRICVCATDGRRMHVCFGEEAFEPICEAVDKEGRSRGFDGGVLISKEIVLAMERMLGDETGEAWLLVSEKGCQLDVSDRSLRFAVLTDGPPDLTRFVQEQKLETVLTINRLKLLGIVKVAAPLGDKDTNGIVIRYLPGDLVRIEADDTHGNTYTDELPGKASAEAVYKVNGKFFLEMLQSATTEEVEIGYLKNIHGFIIREEDRCLILTLIRVEVTLKNPSHLPTYPRATFDLSWIS